MEMRQRILLILVTFLYHVSSSVLAKNDTCATSSTACNALIGYRVPNNLKVRVISDLFGIRTAALLGANDFDLTLPDIENVVVPSGKLLKIPQSCGCIDGTRQVNSTVYVVQPGDTLSKIAGYYGNLITYEQIASANNISNVNLIFPAQNLVIPFHCACYNGTDQGQPAYFLSYQLEIGDTLNAIANGYNTSVVDLQTINGLSSSSGVSVSEIIDIPIAACKSSFSQNALDNGLLVARGSYVITAKNCVQCSCTNGSTQVYCTQTPEFDLLSGTCSNMKCANTNLIIGEFSSNTSKSGCMVKSCDYNGFTNTTILTSLKTELDPKCPVSPPPQSLYKPPENIAASPFGVPETGAPVSSPPTQISPSSVTSPTGGSGGHSSAPPTKNWFSLTVLLGMCFPVVVIFTVS